MNKTKRFLETSGVYFIGSIFSKLISIFLLPLYTIKLTPEEFGSYDLIVTVINFLAPIAFFQIWDGMFRLSFDKQNIKEKYSVISNSFSVMALGIVIFLFLCSILNNILSFDLPGLIFLYGMSVAIQYQYQFMARVFFKNKLFVVSGIINSFLNTGINILLLNLNIGIDSLYVAFILSTLMQILIIESKIKSLKNFCIKDLNIRLQLEMIKFSIPLCVSSASYWMLSGYTKVEISQQLNHYANGLYAVATKFTSMVTMVMIVFQYAWHELTYLMSSEGNRKVKYEKSISYIFKILMLSSGISILIIKIIFPFFVHSIYNDALFIIPLSLLGVAANAFADFVGTIFLAEKKTKWVFWTVIISASINVICTRIFIPIWGLQGAVGALCLSFILVALLRIYAIWKLFNIKLALSNFNYISIIGIVIYIYFVVDSAFVLIIIILLLISIIAYSLRDILLFFWESVKTKK